jgi:hypothetical protein
MTTPANWIGFPDDDTKTYTGTWRYDEESKNNVVTVVIHNTPFDIHAIENDIMERIDVPFTAYFQATVDNVETLEAE